MDDHDDDRKDPDGWSGPRVPVLTWTTDDDPSVAGATPWIALLVATVVDADTPEPKRRRAVRMLAEAAFGRPVHSGRWPALEHRGVAPDDVREAARDVLPPEAWSELFDDADFHPVRDLDRLVAALRSRLGNAVAEALTGRTRESTTDDDRPRTVQIDEREALGSLRVRSQTPAADAPERVVAMWERELLAAAGTSTREREAWHLHRAGCSYAEIGDVLDVEAGTAKSMVHRVRKKLRRVLADAV